MIVTARRPEVLKEMEDAGMTGLALDVTSPESIAKCNESVTELTGGKLDFLVNNAYAPPFSLLPSALLTHPSPAFPLISVSPSPASSHPKLTLPPPAASPTPSQPQTSSSPTSATPSRQTSLA